MNRNKNLERLKNETFDILVIGAGATGAGVALDAASRGLKVALIEKDDFCAQTSSKSTKLIHGGVRYLEQAIKKLDYAQYKMVAKALNERSTLLQLAPHLTRPLALITPCKNWFEAVYYGIGMKVYDWMSRKYAIGASTILTKKEVKTLIPQLKNSSYTQGVKYYDGQLDDARFGLALVQTANNLGAAVANYTTIKSFIKKEGSTKLYGAQVYDSVNNETFAIKAKIFVNATGPFADHVRHMANAKMDERLKVSRGAHIVLDAKHLPGNTAILVPKTDDGRVVFIIPWQGHCLVGTTDTEDSLNDQCIATHDDVDYLIEYANRFLQDAITKADVLATFAGQRPLIQASFSTDTKSLVRDHEVEIDKKTKLVSVLGGKWTTYRLMAKDTIDEIYKHILDQKPAPCTTETILLAGAKDYSTGYWKSLCQNYGISENIAQRLALKYGTQATAVLDLAKNKADLLSPIIPNTPYLKAEVIYQKEYEMAITPQDICRRLGVLFLNTEHVKAVEEYMGGRGR